MTFARYNYIPTITGPGHATFLSGSPPSVHGIIGNDWYDKRTGKTINCVGDSTVLPVGINSTNRGKASPRNFIGSNLADQLRLHYRSKVVGVSFKDRGAILPAGKKPAGAYWFDTQTGNFITSTYYMKELPQWVQKFNDEKRATNYIGKTWTRLLDEQQYLYPDDQPGEGTLAGEKKPVFDHVIHSSTNGVDNIVPSPYANELLADFAKAAIEGEHLGESNHPDLLSISFSANDAVGHKFGPYSQEAQDLTLRLDRQLASLFEFLDQRIGLENITMVLTADHGVAPTPEFAADQGLDSRRFNEKEFLTNMIKQLNGRFGEGSYLLTTNFSNGQIFFNHAALERKGISASAVSAFIREVALETGNYEACFSKEQLLEGRAPGQIGQFAINGFNAERSGDLILIPKPYVMASTDKTGTSHGTPYSYDSHVPMLFYGRQFKPGRYADEFYVIDVAPTLCAALHMDEPAGSQGKPCVKILNH
jgi:predicted AlkP superfamily pyrophosphatase or phosphodiesterase